jgi:hypothetical protein
MLGITIVMLSIFPSFCPVILLIYFCPVLKSGSRLGIASPGHANFLRQLKVLAGMKLKVE